MSAFNIYKTREAANAPLRLPLTDPHTGVQGNDWLDVLGADSDVFGAERLASNRRILEYTRSLKAKQAADGRKFTEAELTALADAFNKEEKVRLIASLVCGWSDQTPCTRDAVIAFLTEAPLIADYIDAVATDRRLFLMPRPKA